MRISVQTKRFFHKSTAAITAAVFFVNAFCFSVAAVYAQEPSSLQTPTAVLGLSSAYAPPLLKGVRIYPDQPFRLDFVLDKGTGTETPDALKEESARLIKYFLAAVTVPESDLWVNLSPYEKNRIVPDGFGVTEMGKNLLEQDYVLKQITASVVHPEEQTGKEFWRRVYAEARKRYGKDTVPLDTYNKVWIVPDKAEVCEGKDAAYVVESRLKVLLEEDYLAFEKGTADRIGGTSDKGSNTFQSAIFRETVIPIIEREVNEGRNFAQLRQIYQSLILAIWFKDTMRKTLFGTVYVDQKKTGGIDVLDKTSKEKIWEKYVDAFKKGAYTCIKKEHDPLTQKVVARKYFSGGAGFDRIREVYAKTTDPTELPQGVSDNESLVSSALVVAQPTAVEEKDLPSAAGGLGAVFHDADLFGKVRADESAFVADWKRYFDEIAKGGASVSERNRDVSDVKRTLFFSPLQLQIGGIQTYQRNLVRTLLKTSRDATVELMYFNMSASPSEFVLRDEERNNRLILKGVSCLGDGGQPLDDAEQSRFVLDAIDAANRSGKIDLIFLNSSTPHFALLNEILSFAKSDGIASVFYYHGGAISKGTQRLIESADVAVAGSEAYRTVFSQLGMNNVGVLPPVSAVPDVSPVDPRNVASIRKQYGLQNRKIILHPGRVSLRKGAEVSIRAVAKLVKDHPELRDEVSLVVLGPERDASAGLRLRLRQLARKLGVDVVFVEGQPLENMKNWYDASYLVLYPTLAAEPFGLVSIEAQARGVPVIVANSGGLPETLQDGVTGLVVKPGQYDEWSRKMYELIADEHKRDAMGAEARAYILTRYSLENIVRDTVSLFRAAVDARKQNQKSVVSRKPNLAADEAKQILSNVYNIQKPLRDADQDAGNVSLADDEPNENTTITAWKAAWLSRLNKSRLEWRFSEDFPAFPRAVSESTPFFCDPLLIPTRKVGPFERLLIPAAMPRGIFSVKYGDPSAVSGRVIYSEDSERNISDDPFDADFMLRVNRFPKVEYDSLIVSKKWREQRLTPDAVNVQIAWAHEGQVTEFHHPEAFVPHFHMHLNTFDSVPVAQFSGTFAASEASSGNVEIGRLTYPVPHIALRSKDDGDFRRAVMQFADSLESRQIWFLQTLFKDPSSGDLIAMFFLPNQNKKKNSFSTIGFLKTSDADDDDDLLNTIPERFVGGAELSDIVDPIWARWKAEASSSVHAEDLRLVGGDEKAPLGGVDLTRSISRLRTRAAQGGVRLCPDYATSKQLRNAAGLTPVIIDLQPMATTAAVFLSVKNPDELAATAKSS